MGGRTKWLTKANIFQLNSAREVKESQDMRSRIEYSLLTAKKQPGFDRFGSDDFASFEPPTPEQELEKRRLDLRNGLTDRQRLFLFGKLGGLNDKDAALAAGYSVSVAENTKQRIWKPQVCAEYERVRQGLSANAKSWNPDLDAGNSTG